MRNNMDFEENPSEFYGDAPDGSKKISRILLGTASAPYSNGAQQKSILDENFYTGKNTNEKTRS